MNGADILGGDGEAKAVEHFGSLFRIGDGDHVDLAGDLRAGDPFGDRGANQLPQRLRFTNALGHHDPADVPKALLRLLVDRLRRNLLFGPLAFDDLFEGTLFEGPEADGSQAFSTIPQGPDAVRIGPPPGQQGVVSDVLVPVMLVVDQGDLMEFRLIVHHADGQLRAARRLQQSGQQSKGVIAVGLRANKERHAHEHADGGGGESRHRPLGPHAEELRAAAEHAKDGERQTGRLSGGSVGHGRELRHVGLAKSEMDSGQGRHGFRPDDLSD